MAVAGVILAGGRSTRMGSPKALLDFRGVPFVVGILGVLEALEIRPRVLVVPPEGAAIRGAVAGRECLVIENADVDGGPIASLRVAIEALRPLHLPGALVWPVDLLHVRVATIERLRDARRREPALAILPTFAGRRGHPVLWVASAWEELLTSPAATREGARAVLRAHPAEVRGIPVDDPAVIDSLNTAADYERMVPQVKQCLRIPPSLSTTTAGTFAISSKDQWETTGNKILKIKHGCFGCQRRKDDEPIGIPRTDRYEICFG